MSQLVFSDLFKQAIIKWPKEIDLSEIQYSDSGLYTVKGLSALLETIEEYYIGGENEVIWRDLQCAIYEVIHSVAKYCLKIRISELREEYVCSIFERRLKISVTQNLGWNKEDFLLVESYFAQNTLIGSSLNR